jgi:hypothetical protein
MKPSDTVSVTNAQEHQ